MKYLITGIGNPGEQYAHTRHNIGFDILDAFAASNISFKDKRYGFIAEMKFKARTIYLLKPSTYVNLSGRAVQYYMGRLKIPQGNSLVVVDDLALPFGTLRLKTKGGDSGHNGLTSIINTLGTSHFPRLRFGIGSDFPPGMKVDYVLGKWDENESQQLPGLINNAVEIIQSFVTLGIERTMNQFNKK